MVMKLKRNTPEGGKENHEVYENTSHTTEEVSPVLPNANGTNRSPPGAARQCKHHLQSRVRS